MIEPTTLDIKSLMNTAKIKEEDNELMDDIDDLMKDDIMNDYNKDNNEDNEDEENDNEEENEEEEEDEPFEPAKRDTGEINPNDFKEMLDNGEYESLTPQQQRIVKYDLLMKLADLVKTNGIQVTTDYTMDDDFYEIKREYDYHIRVRGKKRTVSTIYSGIICGAKGIEFLNKKFDPFGVNLDGFTLNLESSREEMLDVLTELYDKYFGMKGKEVSPEMELALIFIRSLIMTIITNTASSYISTLFDKPAFNKEELKRQIKTQQPQSQPIQPIFQRSSNVMDEFNKEVDVRNVKLTPMPEF